jgi:hypothetical protein
MQWKWASASVASPHTILAPPWTPRELFAAKQQQSAEPGVIRAVILLVSRVLDPWLNRTVPVVLYMTEAWGQHAPVFSTYTQLNICIAFKRTGTAPKHLQHSCVAHLCKTLAGAQKLFKSII